MRCQARIAILINQFQDQVDSAYAQILTDLNREDADLAALARRYQQVRTTDYFYSKLGERVREALLAAKGADDR